MPPLGCRPAAIEILSKMSEAQLGHLNVAYGSVSFDSLPAALTAASAAENAATSPVRSAVRWVGGCDSAGRIDWPYEASHSTRNARSASRARPASQFPNLAASLSAGASLREI